MCAVAFVFMVSFTMMTVALPQIQSSLDMAPADLQWLITGYGLTFGGLLLVGGRLADYLGRRRALLLGLAVFVVGSVLGTVAPSTLPLIIGRAAQGVGAAIAMPAAMAILISSFQTSRQRALAFGAWAAVNSAGAVLGNVVGGFLSSFVDWRWMFVTMFVGGVLTFPAVLIVVRRGIPNRSRPAGFLSGVLLTVTIGSLILGTSLLSRGDSSALTPWIVLSIVPIAFLAFVFTERASRSPLIPITLLRNKGSFGFASIALSTGASMSMYYFASLFLQDEIGLDGVQTGLAFALWAGMSILSAQAASRLVVRFGARKLMPVGFLCIATGGLMFGLQVVQGADFSLWMGIAFVVIGSGTGLLNVTATVVALFPLPDEEQGLGAGIINAAQQSGGVVGLSVMVLVASAVTASAAGGVVPPAAIDVIAGMQVAVFSASALCAVCAPIAGILLPRRV